MALTVFDSGDAPYFRWLRMHPEGYVVNTRRRPTTGYFTLHRASCRTIRTYGDDQHDGGFTEREYVKVCADDPEEIRVWAAKHRQNVSGLIHRCGACRPDAHLYPNAFPDEIGPFNTYAEGAARTVLVNAYERKGANRRRCIEHWGASCVVCELRFEERYGGLGEGFIHVHHLRPLASVGGEHDVDPVRDLVPVCPNCHAMLHTQAPPLTPEQLRSRMGGPTT